MEDSAAILQEQVDAYDKALLKDVCRESAEAAGLCWEGLGAASTAEAPLTGSNEGVGVSQEQDDNDSEATGEHPSPATLRRLRLLRFQPDVQNVKKRTRRRRSEVDVLTDSVGTHLLTRTRSTRDSRTKPPTP